MSYKKFSYRGQTARSTSIIITHVVGAECMLRATYLSINIIYTPAAVYVSAETSLFGVNSTTHKWNGKHNYRPEVKVI